jgi:hypothetical protein
MAIRLTCPRCNQPLSVPAKKAGSYGNCPRCSGRFWIPKDAQDTPSSDQLNVSGTLRVPPAGLPDAPQQGAWANSPGIPAPPPIVAPPGPPVAPPQMAAPPRPGPVAPEPPRRVAKLIAADPASSNFTLAADGQLPHLQLREAEAAAAAEVKSKTVHPLVLLGVLGMSIALSLALVLIDVDSSSSGDSQRKAAAREIIERQYFGDPEHAALAPYQVYLREAKQARYRGDEKAERQNYRKVLDLLRAEPRERSALAPGADGLAPGVTGSRDNDRHLEQQIAVLLGD